MEDINCDDTCSNDSLEGFGAQSESDDAGKTCALNAESAHSEGDGETYTLSLIVTA